VIWSSPLHAAAAPARRSAAILAAVLALAAAMLFSPAGAAAAPSIGAPSAIAVETTTGDVAFERAADRPRSIASATKLMTALLALERAAVSDVFTAGPYRPLPVESQLEPSLRPGERMTVGDLLRGLLLESANDAAVAIAENVSDSRAGFVRAMNVRADELGLEDTHFVDPIGIGPGNRSTARDLVRLTLELRTHPFFRRVVAQTQATLGSGDRPRTVANRNTLVAGRIVDGVKTGHTERAGYVLVASGRDGRRVRLVTVVLGARSESARNADTLALLRWGFRQYRRVRAVQRGVAYDTVPIRYRRGAELQLVAAQGLSKVVRRDETLTRRIVDVPAEVDGPVRAGQRIAGIEVLRAAEVIASVPLVAKDAVPAATLAQRTKHRLTRPVTLAVVVAALAGSVLLAGMGIRQRRDPRPPRPQATGTA
jgi:D-alanyl-D-alanine carboxypeptidase (penicillin-binding protein 5/6)